jgi:hypothetical protein
MMNLKLKSCKDFFDMPFNFYIGVYFSNFPLFINLYCDSNNPFFSGSLFGPSPMLINKLGFRGG